MSVKVPKSNSVEAIIEKVKLKNERVKKKKKKEERES